MTAWVEHAADLVPAAPRGPRALRVVAENQSLADVLRVYRADRRLTVRAAGRLVGGSHSVWAQWESGAIPRPDYLVRIARLIDVSEAEARRLAGPDRVRKPCSVGEGYSDPLAKARFHAGLSAADFARRIHVSASLVSRWEARDRIPARHYWPRIAEVLGVSLVTVEGFYRASRAPSDVVAVPALRACRVRRGVTQVELASAVAVDVSSIQRWESRARAPYARARRLAAALGTDLDALARPVVLASARPVEVTPLRALRRRQRLGARTVATRAGVSYSVLLSWERGATRPSWAQARALSRAIDAPVDIVFRAAGLEAPRHLNPRRWQARDLPMILMELRHWHGRTQREMADIAGVTAGTVRAWERGRQRPGRRALERLDRRLGQARLTDLPTAVVGMSI
jgi:transcriptional regulator with XRE-family HTH domain